MFKNYFKAAWKNLIQNKTYSSINIIGLALGLASFIVILLYLNYELSYDKWDKQLKQVYKISAQKGDEIRQNTPAPLAAFLKQNTPEIEAATYFSPSNDYETLLSVGDKKIYQAGSVEANDSLFFKVFPYKMLAGNAATALNEPNSIVVNKEIAIKLFGTTDIIGKTIKLFNALDCKVTAIMDEPSSPSSLNAKFVFYPAYSKGNNFWNSWSYQTYVKTVQPVPVQGFENKINKIFYDNRIAQGNEKFAEFRKNHQETLFVDALENLHNFPKHGSSNFSTVSILLFLAVLLLIAGAINFSNLSIARYVFRAKEVGVRKVFGSNRKQLIIQFLSETGLQCAISLCIALFLVAQILPYFNKQFNLALGFGGQGYTFIMLQIALCLLIVILFSGLYPAVFLSRFNTTKVLKGDYSHGKKGMFFRNGLIVVQFVVSAFFIISVLVVKKQMYFMQNSDKGFSSEQVMRITATQKNRDANFETVRNTLLSVPGVSSVSKTTLVPGDNYTDTGTGDFKFKGNVYRLASVKVSTDYFNTLKIALLKGRNFTTGVADQNTRSAIINEAAAKRLTAGNPVGETIAYSYCDSVPIEIIGVVKNFNVYAFNTEITPTVYTIGNNACMYQSGGAILVKLDGTHLQNSIAAIEKEWKKIEPDFPMKYSFLDDNFQKLFASYKRLSIIITFFTFIAVLISLMGLFALTAFLVGQRTKEIGIRKVLGASVKDIAVLLSKKFILLIIISLIIASPIAWWATNKWLQTFAYRIAVSPWLFVLKAPPNLSEGEAF
jgi:putative ABC transport system permease protein